MRRAAALTISQVGKIDMACPSAGPFDREPAFKECPAFEAVSGVPLNHAWLLFAAKPQRANRKHFADRELRTSPKRRVKTQLAQRK
jgi:hypothetical protein